MPTHYRTCTLCEAMCGLVIETEGTKVTSIRGDKDDVFSKGHICPKAVALQDIQDDPDRLRKPVRRTATGWEEVSWGEAFDDIGKRIREIQGRHGKDAVAVYSGNPTVHNYGSLLMGVRFLRALGTKNKYSATSVDQLPHQLMAYLMFGHQLLLPIPDIDRTHYLLIFGANPAASNGSLMTAAGATERMQAIRNRGGRVTLFDPRRTETAACVDQHVFVRPGTDALVLMAILQVIFAERLEKPGRLSEFTDGLDSVRTLVSGIRPEAVAAATGVAAETIRTIAHEFARAPSAVCYGRFGVSTQAHGGVAHWLINVLNIVTGNLDREGGAMFTLPAVDTVGMAKQGGGASPGSHGKRKTRVRGLPEFAGEFPVAALAEEMFRPGPGQIRAFVTSAGNPVLSTPNGEQLDRALAGLEFMVSIDLYVNETTRHAHYILPPTAPLEHDHYDVAFHLLAVRNFAKWSAPVFPKPPGTLHDWEIYLELEKRIGKTDAKSRLALAVQRRLGPKRLIDLGIRFGPYGGKINPLSRGLTLAKVERAVHGVDLGPLQPMLPQRLFHKNGRIQAAPPSVVADADRLFSRLTEDAPAGDFDLLLIGRRHIRSNNSWMHNYERLLKGKARCTLLVHPDDAAKRGLRDGDPVRLVSRVGAVEAPVEISDSMMPGVVSLPHGWGHGRPGVQLRVASAHAGVSVNDVTDDQLVDPFAGTAVLNGVPVALRPAR